MKFLDETGLKFIATKFKELRKSLTNKVDKVTGKDLSTNDYTNEAKAKVDAIPADPKYTDTVQDLSRYLKKSDVFDNKTFNGDESKLRDVPFSARQGVWLWDRLDRVAPSGELDLSRMVTNISIQDREPYPNNKLQGLLLSGALNELFLRTIKLDERKADKSAIKDVSRSKTKGYENASAWQSISSSRDVEDWIGDFDKRTRENKENIAMLTQTAGTIADLKYSTLKNLKPGVYRVNSSNIIDDNATIVNSVTFNLLYLVPQIKGSLFIGTEYCPGCNHQHLPFIFTGNIYNEKIQWIKMLSGFEFFETNVKLKRVQPEVKKVNNLTFTKIGDLVTVTGYVQGRYSINQLVATMPYSVNEEMTVAAYPSYDPIPLFFKIANNEMRYLSKTSANERLSLNFSFVAKSNYY